MRRRPSWMITATSYENVGSYATQLGMVDARRWLWPSSCCKPSPVERGRPGGAAVEEAPRAAVARRPREIADPLHAEHRVKDVEGNHRQVVRAVRGRRRDPRRHRARLVDALLQDLPGFVLAVEHELVGVLRFVELADLAEDAELAEHALHAERARLVGHDRHHALADVLVADDGVEDAHERHRGGDLAPVGARE